MTEEQRNANTSSEDVPENTSPSIENQHADNDTKEAEGPINETQHSPDAEDSSRETQDPEKADSPPEQHHPALSKEIYSVFTVPQKRAIILTGSFVSWFSPMTGSIYFPALNQIARDLDVSSARVNITVTTYLVSNLPSTYVVFADVDASLRSSKA